MAARAGGEAATRDRVIDRAPSLFAERGTTAVSVRELVVEESSREPAQFLENDDLLRLMHRESSLGDPDAQEVGASVTWRG